MTLCPLVRRGFSQQVILRDGQHSDLGGILVGQNTRIVGRLADDTRRALSGRRHYITN